MKANIRFFSVILLFFNSVSALYGGGCFILDPSGKLLMVSPELLNHTPFANFFIPGLILFTFIGVSSFVVSVFFMGKFDVTPLLIIYQGVVNMILASTCVQKKRNNNYGKSFRQILTLAI